MRATFYGSAAGLLCSLVVVAGACGAHAQDIMYVNGTSGSWDDGGNYSGGKAPGANDMFWYNTSRFSPGGNRSVTLSLDGKTHFLWRFYMDMGSASAAEADPSPLTIQGPGTLNIQAEGSLYHQIAYGREVTFDHVDLVITNHLGKTTKGGGLIPSGRITVRGGRIEATDNGSYVSVSGDKGALVVEDGGEVDTRRLSVSGSGSVELRESTLRFRDFDANYGDVQTPNLRIGANSRFLSLNTTARYWTKGIIPSETNSLVVVNHSGYFSVRPPLSAGEKLAWRGALVVTNSAPSIDTSPQTVFTNSVCIYGRGRLSSCNLRFASDLVSDVDLSRVDIGDFIGSSVYENPATVNFRDATIGLFRGNKGATSPGWSAANVRLCIFGRTTFDFVDPAAPSASVGRTDATGTLYMKERSSLSVCGGGTYTQAIEEMPTRLESYEIGEGMSVVQRNSDYSVGTALRVRDFKMGPNSSYASGQHSQEIEAFGDVSIAPSAAIVHAAYNASNDSCWPAFRSLEPEPPTKNLSLTAMPANYSLYWVGGSAFYANGVDITSGFVNSYGYWLDAGPDCLFSSTGNWGRGTLYSGGTVNMTLSGKFHTVVTNDVDNVAVKSLIFGMEQDGYQATAPFIVRGKPIRVTSSAVPVYTGTKFSTHPAVSTQSSFPQTMEARIDSDESVMYVGTSASGDRRGALYFKGGISALNARFAPIGSVVLGGQVKVRDFQMQDAVVAHVTQRASPYGRRSWTEVMLKPGCEMTVSAQESANSAVAILAIMTNATLTVNGPWTWSSTAADHVVRGTLAVNGAVGGDAAQGYFGKGTLKVKTTDGSSGGTLRIGEGLTLVPTSADWGSMPLKVSGDATVSNDLASWTYSPPAGIVVENPGRALEFDGVGTTVVRAPVSGHDIVVAKKGVGTLFIDCASEGLSNSVLNVSEGAFAWTGTQKLGALRAARGTTLRAVSSGGAIAALEVSGDVDLAGVRIELSGEGADCAASSWTTLLSVPAGASLSGEPVADSIRLRVVANALGGMDLQAKAVRGLIIKFR